jgi:hypothetical protein
MSKDITVLLFSGKMYSGKTISAQFLQESFGYNLVSFATPLKELASNHYCPGELISKAKSYRVYKKESESWEMLNGRDILVQLGEAIKNHLDYSWFYVELALKIKEIHKLTGQKTFVVDDCRFEKEYLYFNEVFNTHLLYTQTSSSMQDTRAQYRDGITPTEEQKTSNTENFDWVAKYPSIRIANYSNQLSILHEKLKWATGSINEAK